MKLVSPMPRRIHGDRDQALRPVSIKTQSAAIDSARSPGLEAFRLVSTTRREEGTGTESLRI